MSPPSRSHSRHTFLPHPQKLVPESASLREKIRTLAEQYTEPYDPTRPPSFEAFDRMGKEILLQANAPMSALGFAIVALSNSFWRSAFSAVPAARRILLLPHCLRDEKQCKGTYFPEELACAECGACGNGGLKQEAEALGYRVLIAEGTPGVMKLILEEEYEAILGIACLDSLEKGFGRIAPLGVPHLAVPLLQDGCTNTKVELTLAREFLYLHSTKPVPPTESYVPLLRVTTRMFHRENLSRLLAESIKSESVDALMGEPMVRTDAIGEGWLAEDGKRLRPFITLAAYAVGQYGLAILSEEEKIDDSIPDAVRRVAVAIESLHKASLVHDDIEDEDEERYGQKTLHVRHGIPAAINTGDFLVGLGYHLIANEHEALGGRCVSEILASLSDAQLRLCRGQGAELLWWKDQNVRPIRPVDALAVYAAKTAPGFEAALFAGLRMAEGLPKEMQGASGVLRAYARSLGVAFQILNDLENWDRRGGQDALAGRPTLIHCLALDAADESVRIHLEAGQGSSSDEEYLCALGKIYSQLGAFAKATELVQRYRNRANALAHEIADSNVSRLLGFLTDVVLGEWGSDASGEEEDSAL